MENERRSNVYELQTSEKTLLLIFTQIPSSIAEVWHDKCNSLFMDRLRLLRILLKEYQNSEKIDGKVFEIENYWETTQTTKI